MADLEGRASPPERGGKSETEGGKEMVEVLIAFGLLLIVLIAAAFLITTFFQLLFQLSGVMRMYLTKVS